MLDVVFGSPDAPFNNLNVLPFLSFFLIYPFSSGGLDAAGKSHNLFVSNLAGRGKIISAIAYYNPTDKTNIIEITCEAIRYSSCNVFGSSITLESVTKIGISEYSDSIHTNYVVGQIKNW